LTSAKEASAQLKVEAEKQVEQAAGKIKAYMEGKEIKFEGGKWDIKFQKENHDILDGIKKIMLENPMANLDLHGIQDGANTGSTHTGLLVKIKAEFPDAVIDSSNASAVAELAYGRVWACKKVLLDAGIAASRITTTTEVGTIKVCQFIPVLGELEEAETETSIGEGEDAVEVLPEAFVFWIPSELAQKQYEPLQCKKPTLFCTGDAGVVSMETETEQATVLYTADATSAPSTEYASSDQPKFNLLVAEQQTFRAIARREGFKDSEEATIDHKPATVPDPEIERVGPDVNQAVITCTDKTATIHYKFDESETKQEHSVDTHVDLPCETPQPVVVWAQATKPGLVPSKWVKKEFIPAAVPDPEIKRGGPDDSQVFITCTYDTATIHYKLDESETKEEYATFVELPCETARVVVVRAQATKPGLVSSKWVKQEFTIDQVKTPINNVTDDRNLTVTCATANANMFHSWVQDIPVDSTEGWIDSLKQLPVVDTSKKQTLWLSTRAEHRGMAPSAIARTEIVIDQVKRPKIEQGVDPGVEGRVIRLTCSTVGANIEFTLDEKATDNKHPFNILHHGIEKTVQISAVAKKKGMAPSDEDTSIVKFEKMPTPVITETTTKTGKTISMNVPPERAGKIWYDRKSEGVHDSKANPTFGFQHGKDNGYKGPMPLTPVEGIYKFTAVSKKDGFIQSDRTAAYCVKFERCEDPVFEVIVGEGYMKCSYRLSSKTPSATIQISDNDLAKSDKVAGPIGATTYDVKSDGKIERERPQGIASTDQQDFIVYAQAMGKGKLPSMITHQQFSFIPAPNGKVKGKTAHDFEVECNTRRGGKAVEKRDDEGVTNKMGVAQTQQWLRRHRADTGGTLIKPHVPDVLKTLNEELRRTGEMEETALPVTLQDVIEPPRAMTDPTEQAAHKAMMTVRCSSICHNHEQLGLLDDAAISEPTHCFWLEASMRAIQQYISGGGGGGA
jgi:hypothetical protein